MDTEALDRAISELNQVIEGLLAETEPPIDDLVAWGTKLPEMTYGLVYATRVLRERVLDLGNRFVLTDAEGREPEERIIETADALRALTTLLERGDPAARDYCDAIKHVGVERALEEGEPPSMEVRTSTAADMARRRRSTTHVDREPPNLMNDTVLGHRIRP